jgi:HicA toxin of bacterial toxin-antitoxin,
LGAVLNLNKKQRGTLEGLFTDPVRANIAWHDVESLLVALGAELAEGRGSRVRVALNGIRAVFHRPHPGNEVGKPTVRSLRGFLSEAGIHLPD